MPFKAIARFWRADWYLSFLCCMLLLVVFVLFPLSGRGPFGGVLLQLVFSLILISGAALVANRPAVLALALLLAAGTAAIGWIRLFEPGGQLTVLDVSLWILFLSMLAAVILVRVFREGKINIHRILGAVCVYLLLGVIWAGCYRLVIQFDPAAFNLPPSAADDTVMPRLVYFSFVTLTTLGYGDVTAVNSAARSLALLEALTGQLFPAVLIARLVAMEFSHREGQSGPKAV
jgi:hypothetical protein